jgi:hypothetical protein
MSAVAHDGRVRRWRLCVGSANPKTLSRRDPFRSCPGLGSSRLLEKWQTAIYEIAGTLIPAKAVACLHPSIRRSESSGLRNLGECSQVTAIRKLSFGEWKPCRSVTLQTSYTIPCKTSALETPAGQGFWHTPIRLASVLLCWLAQHPVSGGIALPRARRDAAETSNLLRLTNLDAHLVGEVF